MFLIRDTTRNVIPAGTNKNRWLSAFAPSSFVVTPGRNGAEWRAGVSLRRCLRGARPWLGGLPVSHIARPSLAALSPAYPEQRRGCRDTPEASRNVCFVMRGPAGRCVLSCDVMFAMPSPMLFCSVSAYRSSIAFRPLSVSSAPPPARRAGPFIARICVRARARVGAGAVRAPDCPRARPGTGRAPPAAPCPARICASGAAVPPASPGRRCEMSCDVMFAMLSPMICRSVCAYRFSTAFRPPPFRPPRRRPGGRDPLSRAFACGRGRVSAPVRFVRLIARAREPSAGRTPTLRSRRGFFRGPSRPPAQKSKKAAPGAAFHPHSSTLSDRSSLLDRITSKIMNEKSERTPSRLLPEPASRRRLLRQAQDRLSIRGWRRSENTQCENPQPPQHRTIFGCAHAVNLGAGETVEKPAIGSDQRPPV